MDENTPRYPSDDQREEAEKAHLRQIETAVTSTKTNLTLQRRVFVIHYLLWGNATKAAEKAKYAFASRQGSRLLQDPKIQAVIDEYFHAAEMSAREVVALMSEQARAEYGRYFYVENGRIKLDMQKLLDDGKGHLIKNIDWKGKDAEQQTIEFYDAHAARIALGRIHGKFKDNLDLTSKDKEIKPGLSAADLAGPITQARQELEEWQAEMTAASEKE